MQYTGKNEKEFTAFSGSVSQFVSGKFDDELNSNVLFASGHFTTFLHAAVLQGIPAESIRDLIDSVEGGIDRIKKALAEREACANYRRT